MKRKITITLLTIAIVLSAKTTTKAQSTAGNNTYNALNYIGWSTAGGDLPFKINTTMMTLKNSTGYLGIGTTSPLGTLDVLGASGAASWTYLRGFVNGVKPSLSFTNGLGIGFNYTNAQGEVDFVSSKAYDFGGNGGFRFQNWDNTGTGTMTDLVTILASGNTGIGTTTPASKLDVEGGLAVGTTYSGTTAAPADGAIIQGSVGIGTTAPNTTLDVRGSGVSSYPPGTTSGSQGFMFLGGVRTDQTSTFQAIQLSPIMGNTYTSGFSIDTYNSLGSAINVNLLTILRNGSVGIGTTSPSVLLQVGNSGDGTVAKANAWNTFSDASFKTNVVTIHDALKKVLSLRGVTYNWITSGEPSIGFIAQEVDTVLHCIVLTDTATGYKSLDYSKIVPVVVEAMKQLDSTNTNLAKKDSIKDAKIQALETADSISTVKLQNQDSIITSLQNQVNQLVTNGTLVQDQLNQLLTTINNCCNHSQSLMDNGNNGNTKSMSVGTIPQGETSQTDIKLQDIQTVILEQNVPNPFAEQTTINYILPDNTNKAQMLFYNLQGKLIQSVELVQKGKGQLNVFASDLSNGIYTYTLVVDGRVIDSKKMVKSK
jgi:hypothetical protein